MSQKKLEMAKQMAKAETRIAGLHSIEEHLDLGNGLSLDNHRSALQQLRDAVHDHNKLLGDLYESRNKCKGLGRALGELNHQMLAAVGVKFGRESDEFGKAGGVRPSERKARRNRGGKAGA